MQLALPGAQQVQLLSSAQSVLTLGHVSGIQANAASLASSASHISSPLSSGVCLQDALKSAGMMHMAGVEAARMTTSMLASSSSDPCARVLYVGLWQACQASTAPALSAGPWLRMHAAHGGPPAYSGAAAPVAGQKFSSVEYLTSRSEVDSGVEAALCSRLLEVVQCVPQLGVSQVQLRTVGGMHTGLSPTAYPSYTMGEAACQGILRTAGSECPLMMVGAVDGACEMLYGGGAKSVHSGSHTALVRVQRLLPSSTAIIPGRCQVSRDSGLYVLSGGLGGWG